MSRLNNNIQGVPFKLLKTLGIKVCLSRKGIIQSINLWLIIVEINIDSRRDKNRNKPLSINLGSNFMVDVSSIVSVN